MKNKLFFIFLFCFLLCLTIGYPKLYITDEWISGSQLNHAIEGTDLLHGYSPYGAEPYASSHKNILVYSLAIPVISYPFYIFFSLFGEAFRLVAMVLWFVFSLGSILLIHFKFPQISRYKGIPWTYVAIISLIIFNSLNFWVYEPFIFSKYSEVAAIVFANHVAFALFCVFAFLTIREIFDSDWWGIFGLVATIFCSSYLFWSGNAKDHMLSVMFLAIAAYFFILFIKRESLLDLVSSFISIGLLAWVRPELAIRCAIFFLIAAMVISYSGGFIRLMKTLCASSAVFLGAIPVFINNYGLTGNPLIFPFMLVSPNVASLKLKFGERVISTLFALFVNPISSSAGIFQVSPIALFGLLFWIVPLLYIIKKIHREERIKKEKSILIFIILWIFSILLTYGNQWKLLVTDLGIAPDMRYLSPIYFPMIILALYSIKLINFDERDIKMSLETLFYLIIIDLPIMFIIFQYFWGENMVYQVTVNMWVTYTFLLISVVAFFLVLMRKVNIRWFAYSLAPVMVSALMWELILDFRFATIGWEGYHFWIPVVQYVWYLFYYLFPI